MVFRTLRVVAVLLNAAMAIWWWTIWIPLLPYAVRELVGLRFLNVFTVAAFWNALIPTLAVVALMTVPSRTTQSRNQLPDYPTPRLPNS
jgi:hypothetical protein